MKSSPQFDLTRFMESKVAARFRLLTLTERAHRQLTDALRAVDLGEPDEKLHAMIAESVISFLDSEYFEKSAWFQEEKVHKVTVIKITIDEAENLYDVHLVKQNEGGYCVAATDEAPLSLDYYERRVIEEVQVELA